MFQSPKSRREFLIFMGQSAAVAGLAGTIGCATGGSRKRMPFPALMPTAADDLSLAKGFEYRLLVSWGDQLTAGGAKFGFNNDYLAYLPLDLDNPLEGLMWANHEYHDPFYCSGWREGGPRTKEQCDIERREVGGSIFHVKKSGAAWQLVANSKFNRRLDALTEIPFVTPVMGAKKAVGTFAGCAGGVTPWGTVLSCEENYQDFYGEVTVENGVRKYRVEDEYLNWQSFYQLPPEHYGWVVEVDLKTGKAKKLTALGRFAHEGATPRVAGDGRTVIYMGDDAEYQFIYKFIADKPGSLDSGELFAADVTNGRWLSLKRDRDPRLMKRFKSQIDVLIHAREAAALMGATPMHRPEDVEINPANGDVLVALTNSKKAGDLYGSILKIREKGGDPLAREFDSETFLTGGSASGFACPDNMAFDRKGNLWLCTDMSGKYMHEKEFVPFGNNGLYYIPMSGEFAGRAFRVASAPVNAEFTGPCFAPDGETLFLSVQHPGEYSRDPGNLKSHWPRGGKEIPRPSVVAISGAKMKGLLA